jgi:thiamine pyrophosphate-dependent acetolactate synthase large subunit-like protein
MSRHTCSQAMIEQFLADGIHLMFGNPGTAEQGFLVTLHQYPEFRYILCLQEAIAVAAADAYVRAIHHPVVVQLHAGVGLGNGIGMILQAATCNSPLVVIAGEAGLRYDALQAQMYADLVSMAKPVTKWATRVVDTGSVLRVIRRAVKVAMTPPVGPVFVCLPADIMESECQEEVISTTIPVTSNLPEYSVLKQAARLLQDAEHPMLIIGDGVAWSGAQDALQRVAELLGAEVWGANSHEVNFSFRHLLWQGELGHVFGSKSSTITRQADAILIVGTYVFPEVYPNLSNVFAPGAKIIHIDLDAYAIGKNFPVTLGVVSDPKLTLNALADILENEMSPEQKSAARQRTEKISQIKNRKIAKQYEQDYVRREDVPVAFSHFMEELIKVLPSDVVIFDEALTASGTLTRYLKPHLAGHFFQTRGGSLGVGLPGAIGLQLAYPDKLVVGFTGDGGGMATIQALWTAARYKLPAKFVIINNASYALLKVNVLQYWREQRIPSQPLPEFYNLDTPCIDFVGMAQAMGVPGTRIETPDQIMPGIKRMLESRTPFLLEVVTTEDISDFN